MLRNYLKVTLRNFLKNKTYSLINIVGLGIGLAASIVMMLYVHFELSFDQFHSQKDDVFRVVLMNEGYTGGGIAKIHTPAGKAMKDEIPEITAMTRLIPFGSAVFNVKDKLLNENTGFAVDSEFFELFDFKLLAGDVDRALTEPNSLILSESLAKKYFGTAEAIGQNISITNSEYTDKSFQVLAVVEDVPPNSHFSFSFLSPVSNVTLVDINSWERYQAYTYLRIEPGSDLIDIENRAFDILLSNSQEARDFMNSLSDEDKAQAHPYVLQPLKDIYLKSQLFREIGPTGDLQTVYIVLSLALFVVVLAAINFINLSTARAASRAKEVGIRKTNGARKGQLIFQFVSESVVLSLMALIVAIGIVELYIPTFNASIGQNLYLDYSLFLVWLVGGSVVVGVLAGLYPAFYLSSFEASAVLKDQHSFSGRSLLRKFLVVFQFAMSIGLILASLVIYQQVDFMQTKNLGFEKDRIITVNANSAVITEKYRSLINELKSHPNISNVSFSGNQPGGGDWGIPFTFEGIDEANSPNFRVLEVDENFLQTFGIELVNGRDFSSDISSDITGSYIINEEGARQLGWDDPLGKGVKGHPSLGFEGKIIGVVKDFHFRSLHEEINPIILFMNPEWSGTFSIKLGSGDFDETIAFVEAQFNAFDPGMPFVFKFFDQSINALYVAEQRLQFIVQGFTILGMLVAGIGLFGLASFAIISRRKEFGVRKVLGASVESIVHLLSMDFLKLIAIAFILAAPLAYVAMDSWLNNFAYKTTISIAGFALVAAGTVGFAFLTIVYQALKAASRNPVDSLRSE